MGHPVLRLACAYHRYMYSTFMSVRHWQQRQIWLNLVTRYTLRMFAAVACVRVLLVGLSLLNHYHSYSNTRTHKQNAIIVGVIVNSAYVCDVCEIVRTFWTAQHIIMFCVNKTVHSQNTGVAVWSVCLICVHLIIDALWSISYVSAQLS